MGRQRLANCLALVALSSQAAHASSPDQQPIQVSGFDSSLIIDDDKGVDGQAGTAARIALFPASRIYPDDLRDMGKKLPGCSIDNNATQIDLAPDVCLSGEYYARDNIKILESANCPDGSTPTLMFYQNRRCTGSPQKVLRDQDEVTGRCLWTEDEISIPSYYWSLIYRCGVDSESNRIDGALEHQTAEPSSIIQNVVGGIPGRIRSHHGTMFPCHSESGNRTHVTTYKIDNCQWPISSWGLRSIEIVTPAVCSNGTRAQLLRYETKGRTGLDYKCNNLEMTLQDGLMDVDDWVLNTCIDMSHVPLLDQGYSQALGMMFYCEGQGNLDQPHEDAVEEQEKAAEHEQRGSRVTHSKCMTSAGRYQWEDIGRPTTYMYLKPMMCMSLPKGQRVISLEKRTCPNGSVDRLATWPDAGCPGMPSKIEPINTLGCESGNLASESSYMLWCDDEKDSRAAASNDLRAVVSWDECPRLNMEPGWTVVGRDDGPTIRRVHADKDCLSISRNDQLTVYGNAQCSDRKKAKLSVWLHGSSCRGKPDKTSDVAKFVNTCTQICDKDQKWGCSARFTCEGK